MVFEHGLPLIGNRLSRTDVPAADMSNRSLMPLLRDPNREWRHAALTCGMLQQKYSPVEPSIPITVNACFLQWLTRNPNYQRKSAVIVSDRLHGERSGRRSGSRFDSVATVVGTQQKRNLSRNNEESTSLNRDSSRWLQNRQILPHLSLLFPIRFKCD